MWPSGWAMVSSPRSLRPMITQLTAISDIIKAPDGRMLLTQEPVLICMARHSCIVALVLRDYEYTWISLSNHKSVSLVFILTVVINLLAVMILMALNYLVIHSSCGCGCVPQFGLVLKDCPFLCTSPAFLQARGLLFE